MNNQDWNYFIFGMAAGWFGNLIWYAAKAIISNARKASKADNACNQNCNQGRCCNCKEKK